ncbi:hypothetical protein Tco_0725701 [Tanacetum coccineum]|uniref:Uncharacterized protein n=1 Tax=Tanacetum coccineum TaxID=301880 RepID=A0ABQ4YFU0_9ASTR
MSQQIPQLEHFGSRVSRRYCDTGIVLSSIQSQASELMIVVAPVDDKLAMKATSALGPYPRLSIRILMIGLKLMFVVSRA